MNFVRGLLASPAYLIHLISLNIMSQSTCSLCQFLSSSIGRKIIVALTGLALVLFLAGHLSGNLLIFAGSQAFNTYAAFLHGFLHGAGIWIARIGLLACLVLHVYFTILLTRENRASRKKYEYDSTVQASKSSTIMIWSGLTILAFIIFHLLHYTVRVQPLLRSLAEYDQQWAMTIRGFQNPLVTIFYIISIGLLCSHLSHGVASIFQTLGLRTQKTAKLIGHLAKGYAAVIFIGFISIPIAITFFGFGEEEMEETVKMVEQLEEDIK